MDEAGRGCYAADAAQARPWTRRGSPGRREHYDHQQARRYLKELETHYRLRVLAAADVVSEPLLPGLIQEADELKRIIGKIIVNTKGNSRIPATFTKGPPF